MQIDKRTNLKEWSEQERLGEEMFKACYRMQSLNDCIYTTVKKTPDGHVAITLVPDKFDIRTAEQTVINNLKEKLGIITDYPHFVSGQTMQ